MLENYLRPVFSRYCVDGIATRLAANTILQPKQITLLAGISGIGAGVALISQSPLLACVLLLFSGYCDILDGAV
ncbi:MAG TPA: CDP-alcohol phosphatidyltransferase family protein, partial [Candidatus Berkiella sp.]|nr:CDP-alcohol phosphatidyltransferase family protein [Candidatus Berkiella sp.]